MPAISDGSPLCLPWKATVRSRTAALEACVVPAGLPEPLLVQLEMLSFREQLDAISTGCQSAVACRSDVPNLFSPASLMGQPSHCAAPTPDCSCLHALHCRPPVRWLSSWLPASRTPGTRDCFAAAARLCRAHPNTVLWLPHQQHVVMDLQRRPRGTSLSSSCKHLWTSSLPGACICRGCSKIHVSQAACLCYALLVLTGLSALTKSRLTYLHSYHVGAGSSRQKFWARIRQPKPSTTSPTTLLLSQQRLAT